MFNWNWLQPSPVYSNNLKRGLTSHEILLENIDQITTICSFNGWWPNLNYLKLKNYIEKITGFACDCGSWGGSMATYVHKTIGIATNSISSHAVPMGQWNYVAFVYNSTKGNSVYNFQLIFNLWFCQIYIKKKKTCLVKYINSSSLNW